ncbi:hypothetical protein [Citrobacter freundii]|uniref:Uncharacterized protein n=1 Tax=Citrobacter freundii TaxID=546 RepID=A0A7G2IRC7_CITFR|nr:hypothetical protein [Citrobacter freundii]
MPIDRATTQIFDGITIGFAYDDVTEIVMECEAGRHFDGIFC